MSEDIVEQLLAVEKWQTNLDGEAWYNKQLRDTAAKAALEIESLRLSLKEAEASRHEIIEECAKVVSLKREQMRFSDQRDMCDEIEASIRSLKSSLSQSSKTEGEI